MYCTTTTIPTCWYGRYMCNLCTTTFFYRSGGVWGFQDSLDFPIYRGSSMECFWAIHFHIFGEKSATKYVARSRCSTVLRHLEVGSFDVAGSRKLVRLVLLDDMASTANLSFPAASKTTVGRSRTPRLEKRRKCSRCCVWRRRDARA